MRQLARTRNPEFPGSLVSLAPRNDEVLRTSSEPAFADQHGIAGAERGAERHHDAHRTRIAGAREGYAIARAGRKLSRPVLAGRGRRNDQALAPAPIGHDTPVPPSPQ